MNKSKRRLFDALKERKSLKALFEIAIMQLRSGDLEISEDFDNFK